jgi:hypothetical protein
VEEGFKVTVCVTVSVYYTGIYNGLKKFDAPIPLIIYNLWVFGNRALSRIFGPKREEVTGGWRKLHNEELRNLYDSQNVIRVMKSRG